MSTYLYREFLTFAQPKGLDLSTFSISRGLKFPVDNFLSRGGDQLITLTETCVTEMAAIDPPPLPRLPGSGHNKPMMI